VCRACCGPTAGHALCFACRTVGRRLGLPLAPVVPLRLCPIPGPLYTVLMGYKESPVAEARARFAAMPVRMLADFLATHARCVAACAGTALDVALAVPSTSRPHGAPLSRLQGMEGAIAPSGALWCPHMLRRAGAPVGHMRPDAAAFGVDPTAGPILEGAGVMLLDDTYVSGARAQSAAAALRLAGAASVVVVVLGRVVRPDRSHAHRAFLHAHPHDGRGGCCRCAQAGTPTE
jgi:hypothetical protein